MGSRITFPKFSPLIPLTLTILFLLFPFFVFAATLRVPTAAYPTIQSAIDAADLLDTVLVADGIWKGGGNKDLDFKGKPITVKSENGPANCIIDCGEDGRGFYFIQVKDQTQQLSGFTIRNGYADIGGGIKIGGFSSDDASSPTISNCIVTGNRSYPFYPTPWYCCGGIYVGNSCHPRITDCTITNNESLCGGGIYTYENNAEFTNCIISGNSAEDGGGGIYCDTSSSKFNQCTIQNNQAGNTGSNGGGVYVSSGGINAFTNSIITGNRASRGGGEFYLYSSGTITNCTISNNSADSDGGGMSIYIDNSSANIWNSIFWENTPDEFASVPALRSPLL